MSDPENTSLSLYQRYRKLSLGVKILIYLAMGILLGIVFGEKATVVQPLGDLFIRLLLMAAIPLVFFNLLAGLTSLENIRALGRVGSRIAIYYVFTTVMALTLGLSMMHLLKPGVGMQLTGEVEDTFGQVPGVTEVLLDLIPENIFKAFSAGQMSQIVVFAVFLGITTLLMPKEKKQSLGKVFDVLAELFRKLVDIILHFSPIGIGALAASTVGQYGSAIFGPLALFIGGVWGAQAVMVIIYLLLLFLFTRQSPLSFFKQTAPLYATTAATCSSLASLVVSFGSSRRPSETTQKHLLLHTPVGSSNE